MIPPLNVSSVIGQCHLATRAHVQVTARLVSRKIVYLLMKYMIFIELRRLDHMWVTCMPKIRSLSRSPTVLFR